MRRILILAALAAILAAPGLAQTTSWTVDTPHSTAAFAVRHVAVSTTRGAFSKVTGTVTIDEKDVTKSSVDVVIDVASLDTRNADRDNHLRSADFFDAANHPAITFKSKRVQKAGEGRLKVTGDLTIRGNTREVVLDVENLTSPVKAFGTEKRGASAATRINRKDFGLTWNRLIEGVSAVGDDVSITIDVELNKAG